MTIKQQREQCGWSQEQAAEACEISAWLWGMFEAGKPVRPEFHEAALTAWNRAYKARMNERYGWLLGDWEFDSVGPC